MHNQNVLFCLCGIHQANDLYHRKSPNDLFQELEVNFNPTFDLRLPVACSRGTVINRYCIVTVALGLVSGCLCKFARVRVCFCVCACMCACVCPRVWAYVDEYVDLY